MRLRCYVPCLSIPTPKVAYECQAGFNEWCAWWSPEQVFLNMKRANRFSLSVYQMGQRVSRLYLIWVDGGDSDPPFFKSVMDSWGWMIQVVLRPQQTQGFVLLKKRWVVEQTFGLLNWYRRLRNDDRRLPACSQLMIYISLAISAFKKPKIIFVHISRVEHY